MDKTEFVTPETAKSLKQAGFDWKVSAFYQEGTTTTGKVLNPRELHGSMYGLKAWNTHKNRYDDRVYYSAPTQAVAQRWLRENFDLHISVQNWESPTLYYTCHISGQIPADMKSTVGKERRNRNGEIISSDHHFPGYEAALEAGLQKCLQMIVKHNKQH